MSLSAGLYDLGWRGLLIEADPELADRLMAYRPGDDVMNAAAAGERTQLTFYRVPGTGLGTLDEQEARRAQARGFETITTTVEARTVDDMLDEFIELSGARDIHALSIDVEGAESQVLEGMSLDRHRPWVLCIEAVEPGTNRPTHLQWQSRLLDRDYREVAFDGVNRWYVANERADHLIEPDAGAPDSMTIAEAIAMPFNILDAGHHGWISHESAQLHDTSDRAFNRSAWQREVILEQAKHQVPITEYERQIDELRSALVEVQGSRAYNLSRWATRGAKKVLLAAQRSTSALPSPATNRLVRERHLKHVTINMEHLTDPALLGHVLGDSWSWAIPTENNAPSARPPLPPGLNLTTLTSDQVAAVRTWLNDHPFDSDQQLDSRMDNRDDEVGRVQSALRTRVRLSDLAVPGASESRGGRVAFDARALQSPAFGTRGIGRFAQALLDGVRRAVPDERITLIVDHGLHPLHKDLTGSCEVASQIPGKGAHRFSALVQPSPMTHSPDPLLPLLKSDALKIAVVFDFIPLHYPSIYLRHAAPRAEYAANLDALARYDEFIAISHTVAKELETVLEGLGRPLPSSEVEVAWPSDVQGEITATGRVDPDGPIILMTGDDARKNTFGGLAGIAAATSDQTRREVVVIGMAGQDTRVHHWSIAAAMRPGEARTLGRIGDDDLAELLASASCVVVPSFDEGLSLPVMEALAAGTPVVASDIPAHRELIGNGAFSCDPRSPRSIAQAVRKVRGSGAVRSRQAGKLAKHEHAVLEGAIATRLDRHMPMNDETSSEKDGPARTGGERFRVGIATPWPPQRSGVADFSRAVVTELAALADVTVYTTSDGMTSEESVLELRPISEVFNDPDQIRTRHDAFVSVVGNSHYHLLPVQLLQYIHAVAIAHDTRMVEFYMALRGKGGVRDIMSITPEGADTTSSQISLDDQIDDMRLLSNAGLWEVANRSAELILHSPTAAPVISEQTGRQVRVLPFAHYRAPDDANITDEDRFQARARLGLERFPDTTIHLGSFGYVDLRTKLSDIVVESAVWLQQWGHSVALHLVGSASSQEEALLREQARSAGLEHFNITGYVTDEQYRDWVLAVDLGVQLRISPLLGVSGPLSDFAAYGTPAVASNGLCVDVDTPAFIHRLPDAVSPIIVAEAIERALGSPIEPQEIERQRKEYIDEKSPRRYAQKLLEILQEQR